MTAPDITAMCRYLLSRMTWMELTTRTGFHASTIAKWLKGSVAPHEKSQRMVRAEYYRERRKEQREKQK